MSFIIHWNPNPIALDLGFFELRWYSLLFATGVAFAYFFIQRDFKKADIPLEQFEKLALKVILGGVIGARLGHCLFYEPDYFLPRPWTIVLPFRLEPEFQFTGYQGLASHGGALGIVLVLLWVFVLQKPAKRPPFSVWYVLDRLALFIPITGACIRLGNMMNSEIIGKPTQTDWGVVFTQVDALPRHPGQLYEAICYFLLFFVMRWLARTPKPAGVLFGWFLIFLFTIRFVVEFTKADQVAFEQYLPLNMGQLLSLPFVLFGAWLIWHKSRNTIQGKGFGRLKKNS